MPKRIKYATTTAIVLLILTIGLVIVFDLIAPTVKLGNWVALNFFIFMAAYISGFACFMVPGLILTFPGNYSDEENND